MTTRHVPDLKLAQECIRQAVKAVESGDTATADEATTAALSYLQPELAVSDEKDEPLVRVHIGLTGQDDTTASEPMPLKQGQAHIDWLTDQIGVGRPGVFILHLGGGRRPAQYNICYIDTWFLTDHKPKKPREGDTP